MKTIFFECLLGLVTALLYSLELTIDKYLMFSKYINSYEIIFFQGIIELILGVISFARIYPLDTVEVVVLVLQVYLTLK